MRCAFVHFSLVSAYAACMAVIDLSDVAFAWPGGWTLFEGVTFRVPTGHHAALVGANGIGKTTLLKVIAGEEPSADGAINLDGRAGYMRQFVARPEEPTTIREFLLSFAERPVASAGVRLSTAEARLASGDTGERAQLAYADALAAWEDAGGYRAEVLWDTCTVAAFGVPYLEAADRQVDTLSGGEQKRLALELMFRSSFDVLLLDEPDNHLDIEGKTWLEDAHPRERQDDPVREPRPGAAGRDRDPRRHPRGPRRLGASRRLRHLRRGPRGPPRAPRRGAPALRRAAPAAHRHLEGDEAQGRVQRRLGVEGALDGEEGAVARGP